MKYSSNISSIVLFMVFFKTHQFVKKPNYESSYLSSILC